jgi:hypothetical protein
MNTGPESHWELAAKLLPSRRSFLKTSSLTAAGLACLRWPVMAGPFTRAVHDRYHPSRRNPWNEVECGDHYARSMASYGVFIAACGFEYHGPKQHIGFAPRLTPENFKAPFTCAEGWGTFAQQQEGGSLKAEVTLRWGKLKLRTLSLAMAQGAASSASVLLGTRPVPVKLSREGRRVSLTLGEAIEIAAGDSLTIRVS